MESEVEAWCDTAEAWCETYVSTTELAWKLAPPPPPDAWDGRPPVRIASPGRPPELREGGRTPRIPKPTALREPIQRARLFAIFHHHELQAAELMCWAVLAFADTPVAFRRGLLKIALDEIEHMSRYRRHLELQGAHLGDFPVRDWFWDRVPSVADAAGFVATMGLGFEGGNLDHTARFAGQLRRGRRLRCGNDAGRGEGSNETRAGDVRRASSPHGLPMLPLEAPLEARDRHGRRVRRMIRRESCRWTSRGRRRA